MRTWAMFHNIIIPLLRKDYYKIMSAQSTIKPYFPIIPGAPLIDTTGFAVVWCFSRLYNWQATHVTLYPSSTQSVCKTLTHHYIETVNLFRTAKDFITILHGLTRYCQLWRSYPTQDSTMWMTWWYAVWESFGTVGRFVTCPIGSVAALSLHLVFADYGHVF